MVGTRGAVARSLTSARRPRAADRPPLSTRDLSAAGLSSGLLLGEAAAIRFIRTNRSRSLSRQSRSALARRPSAAWPPARYACMARLSSGFWLQAGSANRRSRRSGAIGDRPRAIRASSAPRLAAWPATCCGRLARPTASRRVAPSGRKRRNTPRAPSASSRSSAPARSPAASGSVAEARACRPGSAVTVQPRGTTPGPPRRLPRGTTPGPRCPGPQVAGPPGAGSCRSDPSAGWQRARRGAGTCTRQPVP
jgi:hypothetical protein